MTAGFRSEVPPHLVKIIRKLPPDLKRSIQRALIAIREDPTSGTELKRKLEGYRRFRVRRFRIVYEVDRRKRLIRIIAIGHRRTIYEELAEADRIRT